MFSLIFDLDDTLYFQKDQFFTAVKEMNFHHARIDIQQLYENFQQTSEATYLRHDRGEINLLEMRQQRIQQAYEISEIKISQTEAMTWQLAYEAAQNKIKLSPVMVDLFEECQARGIQLGIITNGPSDHQRRKISALGLERWFSPKHILVSGDLGISKPDPRIFQQLKEQLPQKTKSYYYIGDNPKNDMLGALNVGWQGIWLDCKGEALPAHMNVTVVQSQVELVNYILTLINEEN